jgi:5-methylthioribose kinase
MHAEKLGQILCEIGYDSAVTERVKSLVRKERLKADAETQLLEDTACLVFLESYFADFSQEHDEAKLIDIVRKTWKKMSQRGHEAALQIALSPGSQAIVEKAIAGL